ncbi:hypothetical protein XENORESO_012903 [Xenotaenia resolanae]|uniref:Uncharacterized protein n=1 Tax=Xenotaenia resolanae TaxID=208358 RepID=A0ABV0W972_9TELE
MEDEMLWWREVKNCCEICTFPSQLVVRWEGPGREKPLHHNTGGDELDQLPYKPVKVTNIFICGGCRITTLPRVVFVTQWAQREERPRECTCLFKQKGGK